MDLTREALMERAADLAGAFVATRLGPTMGHGHRDYADAKQDAILVALEAVDRWDPDKGTLPTFIFSTMRYWMKDRTRDHFAQVHAEAVDPQGTVHYGEDKDGYTLLEAGAPLWGSIPEMTDSTRQFLDDNLPHENHLRLVAEWHLADGMPGTMVAEHMGVGGSGIYKRVERIRKTLSQVDTTPLGRVTKRKPKAYRAQNPTTDRRAA